MSGDGVIVAIADSSGGGGAGDGVVLEMANTKTPKSKDVAGINTVSPTEKKATECANEDNSDDQVDTVPFSALFRYSSCCDQALVGLSFFCAVLSGANQPAQLILFGNIIDAFNDPDEDKAVETINFLAVCYVLVATQMFITSFLQTACISTAAGRQVKCIREAYFAGLLRQEVAYFDSNDAGSLAASVMESTSVVGEGIGEKLALSVQFLSAFVFGLATAFYYVWELALLLCAVVPLITVIIAVLATRMTKSGEASAAAYNEAGGGAAEALGAIRTVLALGAERRVAMTYRSKIRAAEVVGIQRWKDTATMAAMIALVMWCTYALGLWYGSKLIADDMAHHNYCRYRTREDGSIKAPNGDRCITGGNVVCFCGCMKCLRVHARYQPSSFFGKEVYLFLTCCS